MIIPASYLEDEVRDGFPVPSTIKRAWAVQLIILDKVDAICKKYNIPYYAESGTLLGVVRHGGYIPWDDDLDIVMKRPDYERFLEVAPSELPEGYSLLNIYTEEAYDNYLTRIVNSKEICRTEKFLNENCGFPYVMGIDLFVMDYLAPTKELEEEQKDYIRKLSSYAKLLNDDGASPDADMMRTIKSYMKQAMDRYGVTVDTSKSLFNQLYLLQDKILSFYNNHTESDKGNKEIGLCPLWVDHPGSRYPDEYFGEPVMMDFEIMQIPVPAYYNAILLKKYGSYMKLVRQGGMHGYPFFADQMETLESVWGKSPYEYVITDDMKKCLLSWRNGHEREELQTTRDKYIAEYKSYTDILCQAYEGFVGAFEEGQYELALGVLQKCQEIAIVLGTAIEKRFGEGHKTVGIAEKYCEVVYGLYSAVSEGNDDKINSYFQDMAVYTNSLEESIDKDIAARRVVVILPFKARYWSQLEDIYAREDNRDDTDVYVIPVPYYERNMMGQIDNVENALCDQVGYPDGVKIWDYLSVSIDKLCPNAIIFQNPYDIYNSAVTVNPKFYSDRLRTYTDELIYVPYADVADFGSEDGKACRNIKEIICKPGLLNADKVLLRSEKMRGIYIDNLSKFAGADSREIWEQKIELFASELITGDAPSDKKKTILYYVSGSQLLISRENGINKIRRTLEIFKSNKDNIDIRWYHMSLDDEILKQNAPEIYDAYLELVEEYKSLDIGTYDEAEDVEVAMKSSNAFYGDPGRIVTSMIVHGKPVMLQNVDI